MSDTIIIDTDLAPTVFDSDGGDTFIDTGENTLAAQAAATSALADRVLAQTARTGAETAVARLTTIAGRSGKAGAPVAGGDAALGFYIFGQPLPGPVGTINSFDVWGGSVGGAIDLYLCDMVGSNLVPGTFLGTKTLTPNVRNQISVARSYTDGQYIGLFAATSTAFQYNGTPGGDFTYYRSATLAPIAAGSPQTGYTLEWAFDVSYFNPGSIVPAKPLYIVIDGDSLPAGAPGAGGSAVVTFATQLAALIPTAIIVNKSVSGQNVDQMIADAATDIYPLGNQANYTTVLIVSGEPYNQLRGADNLATTLVKIDQYVQGARDTGKFDLIIVEGPAAHNTTTGLAVEGYWDRVNTKDALRSAYRGKYPNYYVDIYLDSGAGLAFSDYTNATYYQPDQIHFKTALHTLQAEAYYRVLKPYIGGA